MKVLLSIICFFLYSVSNSQDTLSIDQFDCLVNQHYNKMNMIIALNDSLLGHEAVTLIKIENTLSYGVENFIGNKDFNIRKQKYIMFDSVFKKYLVKKIVNTVDAKIGGRMGYYSKTYDIILGGSIIDPNSRYYIRKLRDQKRSKAF